MVDIERLERRLGETLFDLGLMGQEGDVIDDIDRRLAEIANGGDEHRAELARYAIEIMDTLDRTPT